MRQFIEFIPIALFVAVYFTTRDIYLATAILMAGVCIQVGFEYYQDKTLSKRTMTVFSVVILAGTATLVFQDEVFIKWKPTIVNWVFGVALIGGHLLSRDNLLKKMLREHLTCPTLSGATSTMAGRSVSLSPARSTLSSLTATVLTSG